MDSKSSDEEDDEEEEEDDDEEDVEVWRAERREARNELCLSLRDWE